MRKDSQWVFSAAAVFLTLMTICWANPGKAQQNTVPNILIILADDLGYGDLKCYNPNSRIPTPNLNQLASEGMRLTDAYCPVSVCSPSRYALMTGTYPWRSWRKAGVMRNYEPSMIDSGQLTLPEMLRQSGYVTAGFGKWHLGTTFPTLDRKKPIGYGKFKAENNGANLALNHPVSDGPLDHGFDHWLGFSCASECWVLGGKQVVGALQHDLYISDAPPGADQLQQIPLEDYLPFVTEASLNFLQNHASDNKSAPFFLYYAPYVPHIPLAVRPEFSETTEAGQYGDYVHELDHYIGQLLDRLDSLNLTENTLVLFASDNGSQFVVTEKGVDLSQASNSPDSDLRPEPNATAHHPNAPLKGTKWTAWEGGVRTPFIARWPGHIPAGTVSDQLFTLNDVLATLAAVTSYPMPPQAAIDSYNLLPVLMGEKGSRQEVVIQASDGTLGFRHGMWKYIRRENDQPKNVDDSEGWLFNLSEDISESNNLYRKQPARAEQMSKELQIIIDKKSRTPVNNE